MHQLDRSQLTKSLALLPEASPGIKLTPESTLTNLVSHDFPVNVHTLNLEIQNKNQLLNQTTARLRERLPELKAAAEVGEATAHSLMEKVQQTEVALGELEELVIEPLATRSGKIPNSSFIIRKF